MKRKEFEYLETLKPEEVDAYVKSVEAVNRKAQCVERGFHGGGCPYPIRMGFWSRLFSFL
jgi:hypothetical protein